MGRSRAGTIAVLAISVAAIAIMVGSLWPRSEPVVTDAQRADHIASRIRCPFCNGESIAEATSRVARDLQLVIEEQVANGMTDEDVYAYFAARYGETLLLSPPLLGWGWPLWALPLAALGAGAAVIVRRRRSRSLAIPAATDPLQEAQLRAQMDAATRDQSEIAEQVVAGELDVEAAGALTSLLEHEVRELSSALDGPEDDHVGSEALRPRRRAVAGTLTVVLGVVVVALALLATSSDDGAGAEGVVGTPPIDLASVTSDRLEEVVAANSDVVPMRLALAHMLLEEGEVLRAAEHFGAVLARDQQNPEALAALGWISYLAGEHDTAEGFLVDALAIVPDYPQAQWWLANVRLLGLDDPAGARAPLESLLSAPGVPDDVRMLAEDMLRVAGDAS